MALFWSVNMSINKKKTSTFFFSFFSTNSFGDISIKIKQKKRNLVDSMPHHNGSWFAIYIHNCYSCIPFDRLYSQDFIVQLLVSYQHIRVVFRNGTKLEVEHTTHTWIQILSLWVARPLQKFLPVASKTKNNINQRLLTLFLAIL